MSYIAAVVFIIGISNEGTVYMKTALNNIDLIGNNIGFNLF